MDIKKLIKITSNYISDPRYRFRVNAYLGLYNNMPDKEYIERMYDAKMRDELDLNNPKLYNEKLQWLKLYDRKTIYSTMVDKIEAKKYAASIIGDEYIIPTINTWDDPDEIDFETLPEQFVLKCNHNSGVGMYICRNKAQINERKIKSELKKGLRRNYYKMWREWPYRDVKPRILAEKYMEDEKDPSALTDIKFFCFEGEPRIMYLSKDEAEDPRTDFFDMEYNHLPIRMRDPNSEIIPEKPQNFELMKDLAKKLSKGMHHVRVDFYEINNRVYFGEFTFYHCGGFEKVSPPEWNQKMGDWINI